MMTKGKKGKKPLAHSEPPLPLEALLMLRQERTSTPTRRMPLNGGRMA